MTPYEECSDGPFHPFRDHDTQYGWGVRHAATGAVFALIGDKGCAFGLAAALNGHWATAQLFMGDATTIDDAYMQRFLSPKALAKAEGR